MTTSSDTKRGILLGISGYVLWGLLPAYWKTLKDVAAPEILCHRIVWSFVFVATILLISRRWDWINAARRSRRTVLSFVATAGLLAVNWLTFIWAVNSGHILEASLGYYINPLFSVILGVVFLHERLRLWQGIAVGLAAAGVVYLTWSYGTLPWIALTLAGTFGFYGLLRKISPVSAIEGLSLETGILCIPALFFAFRLDADGTAAFLHAGMSTSVLLACAGVATAMPLLFFTSAARRVPLSTLGILQYIAPTLHFLLGVFVYGELFTQARVVSFSAIWAALGIYSLDGLCASHKRRNASTPGIC